MDVVTKDVQYSPGDKWECGNLSFQAETTLGIFTFEETIPGPRHSEDHSEVIATLAGVDLLEWENEGNDLPDWEPPGSPGRWAEEFAGNVEREVQEKMKAWFEANRDSLADFLASKAD